MHLRATIQLVGDSHVDALRNDTGAAETVSKTLVLICALRLNFGAPLAIVAVEQGELCRNRRHILVYRTLFLLLFEVFVDQ